MSKDLHMEDVSLSIFWQFRLDLLVFYYLGFLNYRWYLLLTNVYVWCGTMFLIFMLAKTGKNQLPLRLFCVLCFDLVYYREQFIHETEGFFSFSNRFYFVGHACISNYLWTRFSLFASFLSLLVNLTMSFYGTYFVCFMNHAFVAAMRT